MIILIKSVGTVILENKLKLNGIFFLFCNETPAFYCSPFFNFSDFYLAFSLSDNCSTYCYILWYIIATYATYPHAKLLLFLFVIDCLSFCPRHCIVLLQNRIQGYAALRSWGTSVLWTSWCISAGPYTCSMSAKETTGTWVDRLFARRRERTSRPLRCDCEISWDAPASRRRPGRLLWWRVARSPSGSPRRSPSEHKHRRILH